MPELVKVSYTLPVFSQPPAFYRYGVNARGAHTPVNAGQDPGDIREQPTSRRHSCHSAVQRVRARRHSQFFFELLIGNSTFISWPLDCKLHRWDVQRLRRPMSGKRKRHAEAETKEAAPGRSYLGLNAANFFQAEMVGVIPPVVNVYLKGLGWSYDALGVATAAAGLRTLFLQGLAGWLTDRISRRRLLIRRHVVNYRACFIVIPHIPHADLPIDSLLFVSSAAQSFCVPLLGALALGLAGHKMLNRTMGANQGWNHAGNIIAALSAMALMSTLGPNSVFYSVGVSSLFAAVSLLLIHEQDLDEKIATGLTRDQDKQVKWTELFRDRTVLLLFISVFAFHLANAPILLPVALAAARLCDTRGRKPVMAAAFLVLPVRNFAYSLVSSPASVVELQGLYGIGAGIYGVAIVAMAADLTRGKGRFNTLMGLFATALTVGGVAGPLLSGVFVQHLGFRLTFYSFAGLTAIGAAVFLLSVPEPVRQDGKYRGGPRKTVDYENAFGAWPSRRHLNKASKSEG
ncbi:MAG: drug efflux system protein MdtG [Bryobacterales bacterium]|nr:drug efflux system protein MdtG [Bryobacterales bacterium]